MSEKRIITNKEIESLKIRAKLKGEILEQIYQICTATNWKFTYEEINSVLIDILHSNSQHELKEVFKI